MKAKMRAEGGKGRLSFNWQKHLERSQLRSSAGIVTAKSSCMHAIRGLLLRSTTSAFRGNVIRVRDFSKNLKIIGHLTGNGMRLSRSRCRMARHSKTQMTSK